MQQKRLNGTVAFLRFIRHRKNLQDFYNFCSKYGYTLPHQPLGGVLFHGSQKLQSTLNPNTSVGRNDELEQSAFVYTTDDPNYAIFLAILNLKNGSASVNATAKNTTLVVNLDFVNGPSKFKKGYVHIVARSSFKKVKNREYKVSQQVKVLFTIPVIPADLTTPIYIQTES